MKLYYILYNGDENNPKHFEGITDNFDKWLEEHNSQREEDSQEHAEDFEVEEIKLYLYENKNKAENMANEVLSKIKLWLQNEIDRTELYEEKFCENKEDFILYGRQECAIDLLTLIKQMEKEITDD